MDRDFSTLPAIFLAATGVEVLWGVVLAPILTMADNVVPLTVGVIAATNIAAAIVLAACDGDAADAEQIPEGEADLAARQPKPTLPGPGPG